jgi:hypothetical protein
LGIASCNNNQGLRIETESPSHHLSRLKVCPLGNRACIDDRDLGSFFKGDEMIPLLFQRSHEGFRLELVYLTTECGDGKRGHLVEDFEKVALRCSKYFFDNSKARYAANGSFPPDGRRFPERNSF